MNFAYKNALKIFDKPYLEKGYSDRTFIIFLIKSNLRILKSRQIFKGEKSYVSYVGPFETSVVILKF